MNTSTSQVESFIPEAFRCGPSPESRPYVLTPEQRRERARKARSQRYAGLAYYRIMAVRAAARGDKTAASFYRQHAELFRRSLSPQYVEPRMVRYPEIREEIAAWVRHAEMVEMEAHLTADDYLYA